MVVFVGNARRGILHEDEVFAVGTFSIDIAVGRRLAMFVGGGRLGVLAGGDCYLISRGKPIIVNSVHCYNLVAVGSRNPILANTIRCKRIYARRLVVDELEASTAVLGEMCVVGNLVKADRLVFTDPHTYLKKHGYIGELIFAYEVRE